MSINKPVDIASPDVFDVLSATWILASNDENPIITYKGILHRLGLDPQYDVKGLVKRRGDLFRLGVPMRWLAEWENDMREGLRLPSWIREVEDPAARDRLIAEITPNEVFRSQFRAEHDAQRSPIDIINWGLGHIERLRKAAYESRERTARRGQVWLVFAVGVLNLLVTILLPYIKKLLVLLLGK